jgi:CheY-like chemotaxis protein
MSKILVIEDEALTRDMFQDCLEAEGFQTLGAENGLTGIGLARQHLPNLVLCDVLMPKLSGYEVLKRLRQDTTTATIPFIFITAKTRKVDRRQGMSLGADDYLTSYWKWFRFD